MREVRRAADRFCTRGEQTVTWHSFSFGKHYDQENLAFGPIVAINEERLAPGAGYDDHRHADAEIVTWVVRGALQHQDSTGQSGVIEPGNSQRLSAGTGVTHAERNASDTEPLVFVQMMLASRNEGEPQYAQRPIPAGAGLHPAVEVAADANLLIARPAAENPLTIEVKQAALIHVVAGSLNCDGQRLEAGDELRITEKSTVKLSGSEPAEALVWLVDLPKRG